MDLIINHPDQLESTEIISENLLTNLPAYSNWLFHTQKSQEQVLKDSKKFESRPYQSEYAALYCLRSKNICAGEMGIGKTLIVGYMISAIYLDLRNRRPGTIQIVCPTLSSAFTRWLIDLSCIEVLKGQVEVIQDENQALKSQAPIWLYHQDFLKRKSKLCANKSRAWYSRLLVLKNRRPSLLVVDEIHNYREGTSRTAHLKYLRDRSKRFLGISGSLSDGETELLSHLCRLVYRKDWPYNISEFTRNFGIKKKVNSHYIAGELEPGQEIGGGRYLQQLPVHKVPEYYEIFRRFIHRPTLGDPNVRSCCTYPTHTSHLIKVTPTEEQILRYRNLIGENEPEYRRLIQYGGFKERGEALSLIWPLIYLSSCPWMFSLEGRKFEHLNTILDSAALRDEKVVIFTGLNEVGHQLHQVLKSHYGAARVVRLYAQDDKEVPKSLSADMRVEILDRLQFDSETNYGILSLNLSAESIDLTSVHHAVFWDIPWDPIKAYQAIRRLIRPGSVAKHIELYYLVNERMVDEHLYRLLEDKLQNLSRLMDLDYDNEVELQTSSINPFSVLERVLGALT